MAANTENQYATLTTDLNVDPYYDDFDEEKNYHRLLFKPGLAVQARELTQSQTILQNQIDRFAEHIFDEGAILRGCDIQRDTGVYFIKIRDDNVNGDPIDVNDWVGKTIRGDNANTLAQVVDVLQGGEANYPLTKTLYVKFINSGYDGETRKYISSEQLFDLNNNTISANVLTANTSRPIDELHSTALRFSVGEGIIFSKDHFVRAPAQTVIAGRYSANVSVRMGYNVEELIINYAVDNTLLDPARGSYNYAAPGADRLKLNPVLTTKEFTDIETKDFVEIAQIRRGALSQTKKSKSIYSEIDKYIAKRTEEESGDYLVNGFNLKAREHLKVYDSSGELISGGYFTEAEGGNANNFLIEISPGIAYVKGFRYETEQTERIVLDKGTDTFNATSQNMPLYYGNYVRVKENAGPWPWQDMDYVYLSNLPFGCFSNNALSQSPADCSGEPSEGNAKIGSARIRNIEYESGQGADAVYRMYLVDIVMTTGSFSDVRGIYSGAWASTTGGISDTVLDYNNRAKIEDVRFNSSIFPIGTNKVNELSNQNYVSKYYTSGIVTSASGVVTGIASSPTGPTGWVWNVSGIGVLNASVAREKFTAVVTSSGATSGLGVSASSVTTGVLTTTDTSIFNVGEQITVGGSGAGTILSINSATTMTVTTNLNGTSGAIEKYFAAGFILDLGGVGRDGQRAVTITGTNTLSVDLKDPVSLTFELYGEVTGQTETFERQKTLESGIIVQINTATHPNGTTGPWSLGLYDIYDVQKVVISSSEITDEATFNAADDDSIAFNVNSNDTDNFYGIAELTTPGTWDSGALDNKYIYVQLKKFVHENNSLQKKYFTVNSYPIAELASNTTITLQSIPFHTSPITGSTISLQNVVDFRRTYTETASDTVTVANLGSFPAGNINPSENNTVDTGPWGTQLWFPSPRGTFSCDYSYYLPRIDRIILTSKGVFEVVRGVSKLNPVTPPKPDDGFTLGYVFIPPYPSYTNEFARLLNVSIDTIYVKPVRDYRFTMKQIGTIKNRVDNLEYYTSMSMLESDTRNTQVLDGNGLSRFKNGIFVDNFNGHGIGDIALFDYYCAIEPNKKELIPSFKLDEVDFEYVSGGEINGDLITLPILSHDKIIEQNQVSGIRPVTGLGYNWVGEIFLSPDGDYWVSQTQAPDVNVNLDMNTDAWISAANFMGSTYSSWTTVSGSSSTASLDIPSVAATSTSSTTSYGLVKSLKFSSGTGISLPTNYLKFPVGYNTFYNLYPESSTIKLYGGAVGNIFRDDDGRRWRVVSYDSYQTSVGMGSASFSHDYVFQEVLSTTTTNNTSGGTSGSGGGSLTATTVDQERMRYNMSITPGTGQSIDVGNFVTNISIQPYMRSQIITFVGFGLKPNTKVYAFFDGEDVTAYITPVEDDSIVGTYGASVNYSSSSISSSRSDLEEGDYLRTDNAGMVSGYFRIPESNSLRFTTGVKKFRISDSSTNITEAGGTTTWAEAQYSALGLSTETTDVTISTRVPIVSTSDIGTRETRTLTTVNINGSSFTAVSETCPTVNDPSGQTFSIDLHGDLPGSENSVGVYVTKLEIFIAAKPAENEGLFVELRECDPDSGYISNKIIPFSRKFFPQASIPISDDGITNPLIVEFDSPVYLNTGKDYAWVAKPVAGNPDYSIWIARSGADDINTGNRIISNPYSGVFFQSSNDRVWSPIQEEDATFNLYIANFGTNQTANIIFNNKEKDYLRIKNLSGFIPVIGEEYHGETTLTLAGALTGAAVGDSIVDVVTGANGTITTITGGGNVYTLKDVTLTPKFTTGNAVTLYDNGVATIYDSTISSQTTPTGKLHIIDASFRVQFADYYIHLTDSNSVGFSANTTTYDGWIKGQTNGITGQIVEVVPIKVDSFSNKVSRIDLAETSVELQVRFNKNDTGVSPSNYKSVDYEENKFLDQREYILGKGAAPDTAQMKFILRNYNNPRVSPVIDERDTTLFCIENIINNDYTNEDSINGAGSAYARYISKQITLAEGQDAEDFKAYVTAYKPAGTDVKVYIKIKNREDTDSFDVTRNWIEMEKVPTETAITSNQQNRYDYRDIEYRIPAANLTGTGDQEGAVQYVNSENVTFTGFKYYSLKVVLLSTNPANPPKLQDLRGIALQI